MSYSNFKFVQINLKHFCTHSAGFAPHQAVKLYCCCLFTKLSTSCLIVSKITFIYIFFKVLFLVHFCFYFLNKISDIVKYIGYSVRLFADHTSLYTIVDFRLQAGQGIKRDPIQNLFEMGRQFADNIQSKQNTVHVDFSKKKLHLSSPDLYGWHDNKCDLFAQTSWGLLSKKLQRK